MSIQIILDRKSYISFTFAFIRTICQIEPVKESWGKRC